MPSTLPSRFLQIGGALLTAVLCTAATCDGGDLSAAFCPTGQVCSGATGNGMVFLGPELGDELFDTTAVKPMATGGTQTIRLLEDGPQGLVAFAPPFDATVAGSDARVTRASGTAIVVHAGAQAGPLPLQITDPPTGELFDEIAITTRAVTAATLGPTLVEAELQRDDQLFAPGASGRVTLLSSDSLELVDDSLVVSGPGLAPTSWNRFTLGALAPGMHPLTATTGAGEALSLPFEVAAGPDRIALALGPDGSAIPVGTYTRVCFAAYLGARYIHVPWQFTAENAQLAPAPYTGCVDVEPLAAGTVVVHAVGGGLAHAETLQAPP